MKFDIKDKNEYIRIIKYAMVGVVNTLIDWGVYFVMTTFLSADPVLANVVGYATGTLASFMGNKFFTFKAKNTKTGVEFLKFIVVNLLSLGASTLALSLLISSLEINKYIAKIISSFISMAINYIGSRFFVFDKK